MCSCEIAFQTFQSHLYAWHTKLNTMKRYERHFMLRNTRIIKIILTDQIHELKFANHKMLYHSLTYQVITIFFKHIRRDLTDNGCQPWRYKPDTFTPGLSTYPNKPRIPTTTPSPFSCIPSISSSCFLSFALAGSLPRPLLPPSSSISEPGVE